MKKNVKKVPVILQMEALECGAASLAMILAYYKKYIPLERLRSDCNVSRDGSTAKYINLAAKYHGLEAKGFKMSVEKLKAETEFPVIIHWNFNHFVVLCGFKGDKAVINDPASGKNYIEMEEFDRSFTGIVLKFKPSENFEPGGKPKSTMTFLKKRLSGSISALSIIMVLGLVISILSLIKPIFYKIFTDNILIGKSPEWMSVILTGMGVVLVVSFIAESVRNILLAKVQAKMSISASSSFFWHILHLPVDFFSQRFAGDIAIRQQSNNVIAAALCNQLAPIVLNLVMIGIYLFIMLYYNTPMALVAVVMAVINMAVMNVVLKQNENAAKSMQRDAGKVAGIEVAAVSMIETIKASGAEYGFFEKISGYRTKYNNSVVSLRRRNAFMGIVPELLSGLCTGVILIMGVFFIFNGELTIGALMAFQSFVDLFLSPVNSLTNAMQDFQEVRGDIERVDDVLNYPTDVSDEIEFSKEADYEKLTGKVEIKELAFAYSTLAPALIENFSLKVEKGQMVALVGGSGSGKSTIAKVISGLYVPRSGEVLFDNIPLKEVDRYVFTNSVAVVDQNISLFTGTIKENISMWDSTISEETMVSACKDACIHDDIMKLADGYDSLVAEGGSNFSGGQRQRLEIARAFVVNPAIMILDEATSALDPMTEKEVMEAVKRRNITCFVIAHRLSTIRDADEIIMLEYGKVVERGTHEQLIEQDGKYAKLVRSE